MSLARILTPAILLLVPAVASAGPLSTVNVSTSGVFTGAPVSGLTGIGTSQITFGQGMGGSPPSYIQFLGGTISGSPGVMTVGQVNFFNGVISSSSLNPNPFSLTMQMTVTIDGTTNTFNIPLSQFATLNDGSALHNADTLTIGSLPTFEFSANGNEYAFELLGFGPATGDGFGDANSLTAYEWGVHPSVANGASGLVSAPILGRVTAVQNTPEPATLAVAGLMAACGGLFFRRRRA